MGSFDFIGNNQGLIAFLFIGGFVVWKFIIQPIQNEGQPIPQEDPQTD